MATMSQRTSWWRSPASRGKRSMNAAPVEIPEVRKSGPRMALFHWKRALRVPSSSPV